MSKELVIAHISPNNYESASSFIQANINGLKGKVINFHGGYMPSFCQDKKLLQLNFFEKMRFRLFGHISNMKMSEYVLYRELKRQGIDLIFVEYGPTANAIFKVIEKIKLPLVIHFHGFDVYHKKTLEKHGFNYRKLFPLVSLAIAVSKEMRADLIKMGLRESQVLYSPCGCQINFTSISNFPDRKGFLAVGVLVPKKSPLSLLKAYNVARKLGCKYTLTIIGDGPLLGDCLEYVSETGLSGHVIFHGQLDHDEVLSKMRENSIFVQHSVTSEDGNREGTPVAIIEAQVMLMPVVSTKHAGIQDVISDGVTGFLVDEFDYESMGRRMYELETNLELRCDMGKKGYQFVIENCTSAHHLNRINERIEKII